MDIRSSITSILVSKYPAGLIEVLGIMLTRSALVIAFGKYEAITAPSTEYRDALVTSACKMIENSFFVYTIHIVVLALASWFQGLHPFEFTFSEITKPLPSSDRLLKEVMGTVIAYELLFYMGHRLMHHPRFYRRFHEFHHRFVQQNSERLSYEVSYVHFIEEFFTHSIIFIATFIQHSHVVTLWLTALLAAWSRMYLHTGRNIGGIMSHERHYVHSRFNFGANGLLDWIFGTLYASNGLKGMFKWRF